MSVHLANDLDLLHRDLLSMCALVEDAIHQAVDRLSNCTAEDLAKLTDKDDEIDQLDVDIEDSCLKVLALHQPVAGDLRRITTVMKISSELERVADLSVNIAERACGLMESGDVQLPDRLKEMADRAVAMLHASIDAYVELDSQAARQVCADDDEVDNMNREIIHSLIAKMNDTPDRINAYLHLFSASRQIERVADHATNIAEDVVYLVEGIIIRHRNVVDPARA